MIESSEVDVEVELLSCSKELAPGTGEERSSLPAPAESLICEAVLTTSDGGFMYVTIVDELVDQIVQWQKCTGDAVDLPLRTSGT